MKRLNNYLSSEIVSYIEDKITNQFLSEGDKLPSERKLALQLNVSRNVVREAIKILREKGLVTVMPGKGAFITKPDPLLVTTIIQRVLRNYDTPVEDILEVREELELTIINKAVNRATTEDIKELYTTYYLMEKNKDNVNLFVKYDVHFHDTLAKSTGNKLFSLLLNTFIDITNNVLFNLTITRPETTRIAQSHHLKIIEAIEQRNIGNGVQVIEEHMEVIRNDIKRLKNTLNS